ncbi:hypothetical protein Tco_0701369, partial [Tanacetum coccineum]
LQLEQDLLAFVLIFQAVFVMVQDTPIEETVFMAIEEDDESDDEQEEEDNQFSHHTFMFHPGSPTKIAEMVQSVGSWIFVLGCSFLGRMFC